MALILAPHVPSHSTPSALHLPAHSQGPQAARQGSAKEKPPPSEEASGFFTRGPLSREATLAFGLGVDEMFAVSEYLKELWLALNYINHSLKKLQAAEDSCGRAAVQ